MINRTIYFIEKYRKVFYTVEGMLVIGSFIKVMHLNRNEKDYPDQYWFGALLTSISITFIILVVNNLWNNLVNKNK